MGFELSFVLAARLFSFNTFSENVVLTQSRSTLLVRSSFSTASYFVCTISDDLTGFTIFLLPWHFPFQNNSTGRARARARRRRKIGVSLHNAHCTYYIWKLSSAVVHCILKLLTAILCSLYITWIQTFKSYSILDSGGIIVLTRTMFVITTEL